MESLSGRATESWETYM